MQTCFVTFTLIENKKSVQLNCRCYKIKTGGQNSYFANNVSVLDAK